MWTVVWGSTVGSGGGQKGKFGDNSNKPDKNIQSFLPPPAVGNHWTLIYICLYRFAYSRHFI